MDHLSHADSPQGATEKRLRKSVAAALGAEIDAYLDLTDRRQWEATFRVMLADLRNGIDHKSGGPGSLGFGADEKPLDPFPFYVSQISSLGAVGADCSDVAKFYSLVRGVRGTLINAEHGVFDNMTPDQKANLIAAELAVWQDARELGTGLVTRMRKIADES